MNKEKFSKRLVSLRKSKGLSTQKLADAIGLKSKGAITQFEKAMTSPSSDTLVAIAKFFDVSVDYLLGLTDDPNVNISVEPKKRDLLYKSGSKELEVVKIPVYRIDSPGEEIIARENIIDWQYVPAQLMDHICFLVADDSMDGSGIKQGSIVLVKPQNTAETGRVVVVHDQKSVMIRRINYVDGGVILSPDNSNYQPEFIADNDLHIIGIVTKLIVDVI